MEKVLEKEKYILDGNQMIKDKEFREENVIKGYITGFFDAEGCIQILSNYMLRVDITQTYFLILEKIMSMFGGNIYRNKRYKLSNKNSSGKHSWVLRMLSNNTIPFLEYIYPNSIEKNPQIELALKYQKEIKTDSRKSEISQTEIEQRKWFKNKLEELKHQTCDNQMLKNYDNEINLMKIPKDIREGKQKTLIPLEELYKFKGIDINNIDNKKLKKKKVIEMPYDVFIGYISGFFDGEGCIVIQKTHESYNLAVNVVNTNFDILNLYQLKYNGNVSCNKKEKEIHKNKWIWSIYSNNASYFLKEIYPYLIIKKEQVKYAIEFQEWHNKVMYVRSFENKKKAYLYKLKMEELKKDVGESCLININNNKDYECMEKEYQEECKEQH